MVETSFVAPLEVATPADRPKGETVWRFTKANASAFGKIGAMRRKETLARRKELASQSPAVKREMAANYVESELVCVRRQIAKLNRKIMTETMPQQLHWLASALQKLREQERILDGRPLPGQYRPKGETGTKQDKKTALQPLDGPSPLERAA